MAGPVALTWLSMVPSVARPRANRRLSAGMQDERVVRTGNVGAERGDGRHDTLRQAVPLRPPDGKYENYGEKMGWMPPDPVVVSVVG